MNDRIDEIKTKWNFDVTLPMAAPWGKDDVVWLVGEVERLRGEAARANVTEIKRLRGTLYTVMGACDAECAACGAYYVAKRALDGVVDGVVEDALDGVAAQALRAENERLSRTLEDLRELAKDTDGEVRRRTDENERLRARLRCVCQKPLPPGKTAYCSKECQIAERLRRAIAAGVDPLRARAQALRSARLTLSNR